MQSIYALVDKQFAVVNQLILAELHSHIELVEDISQYLVASGGKRVRPLVTLLVAGALGDEDNPLQAKLATAIEFLHTATLLHDDVVDMSSLRRGKPTANANWGNASSVLVGDFVYSRAFQLMVAVGNLRVMEVLSDTTVKIAEGEVQQLSEIGNVELSEAQYFAVIERKTAQLFAGACESAAIVAGADSRTSLKMRDYGRHLGIAFQLIDDYLDYAGNAEKLGKHVGDDLAEGKLTLPLIQALKVLENSHPASHKRLLNIIKNKDLNEITTVLELVTQGGALDYTRECAAEHIALASAAAGALPVSACAHALVELGDRMLERTA